MIFLKNYIEEEWKDSIKQWKYRGSDNSLFYIYVMSPLCDYLTSFLPKTLA